MNPKVELKNSHIQLEIKEISSDSTYGFFKGYGSIYGNVDLGGDIVQRGAFSASIEKMMPKMLWQHRMDEPIGKFTAISEDAKGLLVEGQILLTIEKGREAYELLKNNVVSGLSIGYAAKEVEYDNGIRLIKEAALYEISIVTFPMNTLAKVTDVKQMCESMQSIDDVKIALQKFDVPELIINRITEIKGREIATDQQVMADVVAGLDNIITSIKLNEALQTIKKGAK